MLLLWQTASHKILEEIIMLNKRIMSLSLAALTTAALAMPALADDTPSNTAASTTTNTSTEVETTFAEVNIAVTVPTTGTATINPYGLPVTVKDGNTEVATITGHQITTQPLYITNNGDIDLSIGATVTATVDSGAGMEIVTTAPTDKTTEKQAFVYLEVMASSKTAAATIADSERQALMAEAASWKKSTYSSSTKTQLLLNADDSASKSGMIDIKAMTVANDASKTRTYGAGSIVQFRLDGTVTEDPEEAWSTDDKFTTTIAFTFKPASST
jgi:hypothetical protein